MKVQIKEPLRKAENPKPSLFKGKIRASKGVLPSPLFLKCNLSRVESQVNVCWKLRKYKELAGKPFKSSFLGNKILKSNSWKPGNPNQSFPQPFLSLRSC